MDGISFQKMEMPDGRMFTVSRSGIGTPGKEFVVNETSYHGNLFRKYGTYDECMDYVADVAANTVVKTEEETDIVKAMREIATENFKRELG